MSFIDRTHRGEWTLLSREEGIEREKVSYCGIDQGFEEYKWLYFTNFNTGDKSTYMDTGVCV